jgi:phosphatidylglycerophosphate synthase
MANLLTAVRLVLLIPVTWSLANPALLPAYLPLLFIFLAIASDYYDGIVARATGTASPKGMLFDHGTDFLFVTSGLYGLVIVGSVPVILPILISIAFCQYVLDSYFWLKQKQLKMSFLGKWNGVFYFGPLLIFTLARLEILSSVENTLLGLGTLFTYILVISTLASIVDRLNAPLRKS